MVCPFPVGIVDPRSGGDRLFVGCGKCGACRYNRRVDWSFRISQQAKVSSNVTFVTLTYCDGMVPISQNGLLTLESRKELGGFVKCLRRKQDQFTDRKLKYVMVGEYGTRTDRPHYHYIFFDLHTEFDDGVEILKLWEKGVPHVVKVTDALIHYITKYHVTARDMKRLEEGDDRMKEYFNSSNGIGINYVEKNGDWHVKNMYSHVVNNTFKQRMPQYLKNKIFKDLPDEYKAEMIDRSLEYMSKAESKEYLRLSKLGYWNPEGEVLHRRFAAAKMVISKGKKSGRF